MTTAEHFEAFKGKLADFIEAHPDITDKAEIARRLGATRSRVRRAALSLGVDVSDKSTQASIPGNAWDGHEMTYTEQQFSATLVTMSPRIKTMEDALSKSDVDRDVWEVERFVVNSWEVGSKGPGGAYVRIDPLFQVKVWLKRRTPETQAVDSLLKEMARKSFRVPMIKRAKRKRGTAARDLEISIMDPHFGLRCHAPASANYSMAECETIVTDAVNRLVEAAAPYAPFDKVVFPFGNDFLHADNLAHTTTRGTPQPEAESWHHVFLQSEKLAIAIVERLKELAPVQIYVIPGNHARQTEFSMGRVLAAWYRNDANVKIDASSSPYKFHRAGVNLIGFEHGHSVAPIRLAALMANETRTNGWADARYCEWHLGDQHRKGSSKPSVFEEQGVSVEYLPGLTPPNEWLRMKALNWQKRAAMAFVWDHEAGPVARLQVNVDSYNGEFMGG